MSAPSIMKVTRIVSSQVFTVESLDLVFSNGEMRTYERIVTRGREAVIVVPIIDPNHFYLVREYAVGVERYEWGLVKGLMDLGETIEEAANRELREEAGVSAKRLTVLKTLSTSPGYMSSVMHVVLAEELSSAPLEGDEPEPLERKSCRWDELDEWIARGDMTDARVIASLLLVKQQKEKHNV